MTEEVRNLLNNVAKYDILTGTIIAMILIIFREVFLSFTFFLGLLISLLNFIAASILIDRALNGTDERKKKLLPLTYMTRIAIVVLIALLFSNRLSNILAFLVGFITHYVVLTFTTIKIQKGSE